MDFVIGFIVGAALMYVFRRKAEQGVSKVTKGRYGGGGGGGDQPRTHLK